MKALSFIAATIALWSFCGDANAQQTRAKAAADSSSRSRASNVTIIEGAGIGAGAGAGAAAAGPVGAAAAAATATGFFNPQWILGQTTNASAPGTFNDCGVSQGFVLGPASWTDADESPDCKRERLARLMLANGNTAMATELLCGIKFVNEADKSTGQNACPKQRAEIAKAAGQVRVAAPPPPPVRGYNTVDASGNTVFVPYPPGYMPGS